MPRRAVCLPLALASVLLAAAPSPAHRGHRSDRDHDGLPDRWERRHGLSTKRKSGGQDPDRDGLSNRTEYRLRLHPRRADSDRDGVPDGREDRDRDGVDNLTELAAGTDPADPQSAPAPAEPEPGEGGDEAEPPQEGEPMAGEIASYAGGVLTLHLRDGRTVSGALGPETSVSCETPEGFPCSPFGALVPGTTVRDYALAYTTAGAVFTELALVQGARP